MIEILSGFDASRTSPGGAIGYMQIGHNFRAQFQLSDPEAVRQVRVNLRAGLSLFRNYLDRSSGDVLTALQKYRVQTQMPSEAPTEAVTRLFALQVLESKERWQLAGQVPTLARSSPVQRTDARAPEASTSARSALKPEPLDTGYLPGEFQDAGSGRSTFTVDNKSSSADAVVRLYLNDRHPAVRSIFVRKGENFTMRNLPPGTYALRYRFNDRKGTFKADNLFQLREEETSEGVRSSAVRVTLYTVKDGNLSMKPVPDNEF
jgi:hypothetical protein